MCCMHPLGLLLKLVVTCVLLKMSTGIICCSVKLLISCEVIVDSCGNEVLLSAKSESRIILLNGF